MKEALHEGINACNKWCTNFPKMKTAQRLIMSALFLRCCSTGLGQLLHTLDSLDVLFGHGI
ncbi:hypothetical protein RZO07_18230 [Pseudomonas protegens]|uniref:hypothetical protein n=1 Tax=Pseudomonas protegens TaxID=380021 RepID=UPI002936F566|nr:hypothetical protein [Pseudomonas protegens]WOE77268.1 hypothetical protein RZO07_18230 [Pseudomonas protegens]